MKCCDNATSIHCEIAMIKSCLYNEKNAVMKQFK